MTSPGRVYTSPIRIIRQSSPMTTRYLRASPVRDYSPERDYESPVRVMRLRPSILNREFDRIEHKNRQHFAYRPTDEYLSSPSYIVSNRCNISKSFLDFCIHNYVLRFSVLWEF